MTRWRDPRLPPSWRHLAPSVARHIPANRVVHALTRMVDQQAQQAVITDRLTRLLAERDRTR